MTTPGGQPQLGKLKPVGVKEYWKNEAQDFTPWLARPENLEILGEALGIEMEVEGTEQAVGPYSADIVCRRLPDGQRVLIENQLEKTDHTHLGQIITYAAGVEATTVAWIAREFTDQHTAALAWLNQHTPAEVAFFAVKIELWKINDSPPAPRFNVVARPNTWSKQTTKPSGMTPRQEIYNQYWTAFGEVVGQDPGPLKTPTPSNSNWISLPIGRSGFYLAPVLIPRSRAIQVELYLSGQKAKQNFDELINQKSEIESSLGALSWERLDTKTDCRIALLKHNVDIDDKPDWPNQHRWLCDTLKKFNAVFRPLVKAL